MKSRNSHSLLPSDYKPSHYTVLCGKKRGCYSSIGNRRFRITCSILSDQYDKARGKAEKSSCVRMVYDLFEFVKFDADIGRFFEVDKRLAREKISEEFRNTLHAQYRSSSKQKQARRRMRKYGDCGCDSTEVTPRPTGNQPQHRRSGDDECAKKPSLEELTVATVESSCIDDVDHSSFGGDDNEWDEYGYYCGAEGDNIGNEVGDRRRSGAYDSCRSVPSEITALVAV